MLYECWLKNTEARLKKFAHGCIYILKKIKVKAEGVLEYSDSNDRYFLLIFKLRDKLSQIYPYNFFSSLLSLLLLALQPLIITPYLSAVEHQLIF